jgi:hypothetical protein
MVTVLHISDLHRDTGSSLTNGSLLESLRLDKERYLAEGLQAPNLAVVSGDVVYGVSSCDADSDRALKAQYDEAEDFLVSLTELFFGGNRERVVLVPGNHDVSHSHVLKATTLEDLPVEPEKRAVLARQLTVEGTQWRWVWSEFAPRRISDIDLYNQRMKPFAAFYKAFYQGRREYPLAPGDQYALHDFPEFGIIFAALSSCCDNDLFNRSGRIHPDCVAGATRAIEAYARKGRIPVAVWHHNLAGGPKDSDYVDGEFLQSLMDGKFVMGLHGHQHRPQYLEHRFTADRKRSLAVISAGTLCGGPHSLPAGRMRAYNVIEIYPESRKGTLHVRDMKNSAFSMPVWGAAHVPEFSGASIEFELSMRPLADFGDDAASEAMELLRQGDEKLAFAVAQQHPGNDWARRVAVEALEQMQDWNGIRSFCASPQSNVEIIKLLEALYELGDKPALREWIESDRIKNNSDAAVQQCVARARGRLGGSR